MRDLITERHLKALILDQIATHNPVACALGSTDDGFHYHGDAGRLDFDFSREDGLRLARKVSPERSLFWWDDVWAEMREDSRDYPDEDTSDWDGVESDEWEEAA